MDVGDPTALWQAALRDVANQPALAALLRRLELARLGERQLELKLRTGERVFVTQRQREQLGQVFAQLIGRPVQVEIKTAPGANDAAPDEAAPNSPGDSSSGNASGNNAARAASGQLTFEQAMELPLVRQVTQTFSNLAPRVVNVRPQAQPPAAPAPTESSDMPPAEPNAPASDLDLNDLMDEEEHDV